MQRQPLLARLALLLCQKLLLGWKLGVLLRRRLAMKPKLLDKPPQQQPRQALPRLLRQGLKLLLALPRWAHKLLLQLYPRLLRQVRPLARQAQRPRLACCKLAASCPALQARLAELLLAQVQLLGAPQKSLLAHLLCRACWMQPKPTLARLALLPQPLPSKC